MQGNSKRRRTKPRIKPVSCERGAGEAGVSALGTGAGTLAPRACSAASDLPTYKARAINLTDSLARGGGRR